tara:strand:+ start:6270 stop:6572 length:303 start_codon:yes stop_codon:yes gene_type:complete
MFKIEKKKNLLNSENVHISINTLAYSLSGNSIDAIVLFMFEELGLEQNQFVFDLVACGCGMKVLADSKVNDLVKEGQFYDISTNFRYDEQAEVYLTQDAN